MPEGEIERGERSGDTRRAVTPQPPRGEIGERDQERGQGGVEHRHRPVEVEAGRVQRVVEDVGQRRVRNQRALAQRGRGGPDVLGRRGELRAVAEPRLVVERDRRQVEGAPHVDVDVGRVVIGKEHDRAVGGGGGGGQRGQPGAVAGERRAAGQQGRGDTGQERERKQARDRGDRSHGCRVDGQRDHRRHHGRADDGGRVGRAHQQQEQHGHRGRGGGDRARPRAEAQAGRRRDLDEVDQQVGARQVFRRPPHQRLRADAQPQVDLFPAGIAPDVHRVAAPGRRKSLPASVRHVTPVPETPPRETVIPLRIRVAARTSTRSGPADVSGRRRAEVHGAAR